MTFLEYQKEAIKTRVGSADNEEYLTLGLLAEVGEVADKLAKRRRDGVWDQKAFVKELGDVLWFVANLADYWDRNNGDSDYSNFISRLKIPSMAGRYLTQVEAAIILAGNAILLVEEGLEEQFAGIITDVHILAVSVGYDLSQVAEINIAKLRDRQARGVIKGDGDER